MKVISIWQPYASLAVKGHKMNETRSWPVPASLLGKRIGIAATKSWLPAQAALVAGPEFKLHYGATGMPPISELPRGCVIGSAILHSCDVITEETLEDITDAERLFGDYEIGRYAWRLRDQQAFGPYYARGQQGIWNWTPPNDVATGNQDNARPDARAVFANSSLPRAV